MKNDINIYALTDSHQECRNLSRLLSGICNFEDEKSCPIILDAGDLFKGIYDRDLSVNTYLQFKKYLPDSQVFITLGNNDFGFKKSDFEYLKSVIRKFNNSGINVVCANVFDTKTGKPVDWVSRYKLIDLYGQKILVTGFCLNNSCARKFGCNLQESVEVLENLLKTVPEHFDKLIILNHHWYPYSKKLYEYALSKGIKIDLIIGGHEHSRIEPDYERNIFYPYAFARSLYKFIANKKNIKQIDEISVEQVNFIPEFENPIIEYEKTTGLKEQVAKRVLNLPKKYSDACPLGTFISDCMQKAGNTDIAFHSTGFSMYPLRLEDSNIITRYDIKRVMCANSTIEKIEITASQLKSVFENTATYRMFKDRGNPRFLQCSQNISIIGHGDLSTKQYKILQITINGKKLLDDNQNPINPDEKFTCTIDPYIGSGEQGFEVLKDIPKTKILNNGKEVPINELFENSLIWAEKTFQTPQTYPCFKYIDV